MMKAKVQNKVLRKPVDTLKQAALSPVMRYDDSGQLTVPNQLNLGLDGKLYLTRSNENGNPKNNGSPKTKPQLISLKESVAWFRLGHDYNLRQVEGERFSDWLKMVENALA
jgi:hypothetical protein